LRDDALMRPRRIAAWIRRVFRRRADSLTRQFHDLEVPPHGWDAPLARQRLHAAMSLLAKAAKDVYAEARERGDDDMVRRVDALHEELTYEVLRIRAKIQNHAGVRGYDDELS